MAVPVNALIFDLGKVLIPFDFDIAHRAMRSSFGCDSAAIVSALAQSGLALRLETGAIAPEAFVRELSRNLQIEIEFPVFTEIWNSIFLPETLISDDVMEALGHRRRLVLLSNTNSIHFSSIRSRYAILRHFHAFVLSYEAGAVKPDPEIYRQAAVAANCPPAECLFIDDLAQNVEGALRSGMPAIRFVSQQQLLRDFEERGIVL